MLPGSQIEFTIPSEGFGWVQADLDSKGETYISFTVPSDYDGDAISVSIRVLQGFEGTVAFTS